MNQENTDNNTTGISGVLPAGTKLGKYEIVERLGSGGQSIVYKGHDPLLDRYVAIKQVAPQLAAEDKFTKRFRDVARQLASLGCEQVVTLYELMEEDGGLFVVMEFVEGHTIETTLEDHPEPVDPKAVLQIIWRLATGLTAIHKAGIVHRDIKPGNIIIGEGLKVKITDFGVAAKAGAVVSMKLGTTKYMAPELFTGGEVDGRSDIYSLGMIAYEMLLGRAKFNEVFHDVVRDPHSEALRWMKWHSSPDQIATPLAEINPDIPKALSVTVAKMLAKDPDERFASIEELGKEIRANFSPRAHRPRKRRGKKLHATGTESKVHAAGDKKIAPDSDTSGPATAEIPKEQMSLRKKLAIIGTIAGIVIVGLIVFGMMDRLQQGKIRDLALTDYRIAEKLYKEASKAETSAEKKSNYTASAEAFGAIYNNKQYTRQIIREQAKVKEYLCRAHLAALDGDWNTAYSQVQSAGELTKQLQRKRGDLDKWTQTIEQQLRDMDAYLTNRRQYVMTIDQAKKAISDGDLEQALKELTTAARLAISTEQDAEVRSLRRDIDEKQKQSEYWLYIRRGDGLAKDGDVDGAIAEWNKALAVLETAKGTLKPKMYSDLKKTAEKKKTVLRTETDFKATKADAQKAEDAKNLLVAADAYEKAAKIKPDESESLLTKARDLRHDHYLQLGRQHLAANKLPDAKEALEKAQSYKNSSDVQTELKKILQVQKYRSLLRQGNKFFRQKKYKVALEKYQAAGKLSSDAELQSKMKDCNYQIKLAEAEAHSVNAEWAKAKVAYNKARQIKPSTSAEIDARLELLRQNRIYAEEMGAAKRALKGHDLKEALRRANSAKNVRATPEVEEIIKRVRYEQQVVLGKEAMSREDYNSAAAYFRQAKRFLGTPEIDKLIDQAEKSKAASPGDS